MRGLGRWALGDGGWPEILTAKGNRAVSRITCLQRSKMRYRVPGGTSWDSHWSGDAKLQQKQVASCSLWTSLDQLQEGETHFGLIGWQFIYFTNTNSSTSCRYLWVP